MLLLFFNFLTLYMMESAMNLIFVMVISKVISLPQQTLNSPNFLSPQCRSSRVAITEKPYQCCDMPELMTVESMASCGLVPGQHPAPSLRDSVDCARTTCSFRNNDMLFDNDEIDNEAVKQYMDEFAQKYTKYLPAVNAIKERCASGKPLFGPPQMCTTDKLRMCIELTFYDKCPDWLETDGCYALRSYMEDCMPYFNM